jgi:hypothetical protein
MQLNSTHISSLRELDRQQLDEIGGGGASTEWGVSTGVATAFTAAAATAASPLIAGALAVSGVLAAGAAIYYAIQDMPSIN